MIWFGSLLNDSSPLLPVAESKLISAHVIHPLAAIIFLSRIPISEITAISGSANSHFLSKNNRFRVIQLEINV